MLISCFHVICQTWKTYEIPYVKSDDVAGIEEKIEKVVVTEGSVICEVMTPE